MDVVSRVAIGAALVGLTLVCQCVGMGLLIHRVRGFYFGRSIHRLGPVRIAILVVRFTSLIIVLHLLQILLWAGFYRSKCIRSWEAAFYFSTTNYSTVGSGDILLPSAWRNFGAIESITGVLMCGLSASFLFALVMALVQQERRLSHERTRSNADRGSRAHETGVFQPLEKAFENGCPAFAEIETSQVRWSPKVP